MPLPRSHKEEEEEEEEEEEVVVKVVEEVVAGRVEKNQWPNGMRNVRSWASSL